MNETIIKQIKAARMERGLTQQDLADQLGRTAAAISDLERGKVQVTASDLYKLSRYLI
jgi:transcriptional regulator with XRE-family HTH domain